MARSTYIYLVQRNGDPVAAFTVKGELVGWLRRQPIVADLDVFRAYDNPSSLTPGPMHVPLTALGWPW